jgi:hypothetical protein
VRPDGANFRRSAGLWFIFKPKIQIWVNFGGPWNGKYWQILWSFGIFYGHLANVVIVWYIFSHFGSLSREKSGNPAVRTILRTLLRSFHPFT